VETQNPDYEGMADVCAAKRTYLRIFGKPEAHVGRRMGVVVCWDTLDASQDARRDKCKALAAKVKVTHGNK
jgi:phosphoribosylglycinamide formyltransferase 2